MGLHGKGANIADSDGRHKRNKCCCALKHLPLLIFPAHYRAPTISSNSLLILIVAGRLFVTFGG
jgi:hypothetical protein